VSDPGRVDAVMLRRSRVLRNAGIAVAVCGCVASFLVHADMSLVWLIALGTMGFALAVLGSESNAVRTKASLDADGVVVGDRVMVARSTIRSGWIERNYQGTRVHLDRGLLPEVEFEAADDAEARTLLRALGCDPSQTVVKFPSPSRFAAIAGALGGQFSAHALIGHDGAFTASLLVLSLASCLFWYVLVFAFARQETAVGSDGVLFYDLFRSRFVAFAEVESAVVEAAGKLVVRTRTERTGAIVRRMKASVAEAAAELIQSAIASAPTGSETLRLQLRREGDVGAWLARLRSLAAEPPYRAVALGGDALWRVVDDPGATGVERAAAAVVLGSVATPAERARLRDAAARMASPRVRVAIQRAAAASAGAAARAGANGASGDEAAADEELALAMEALAADSAA
jgi:hypothetical protein